MIFLLEYDRSRGVLITMRSFVDSLKHEAEDARLNLELKLNREGIQREVVLLEAASEEALRRTHNRYFEDLVDLAKSSASSTGAQNP